MPQINLDASKILNKLIDRTNINPMQIEGSLEKIAELNLRLVLVVDNADAILGWPKDTAADVLAIFRSLSSRSSAFGLVLSSKYTVSHLNIATSWLNPHGSPFFNTYLEIRVNNYM